MRFLVAPVALTALWLSSVACGSAQSPAAAQAQSPAPGASDPVATVGGTPITRADLDALVAPQIAKLDEQAHQIRRAQLDELIAQKLIEAEAKARNLSPEALEKAEVTRQGHAAHAGRRRRVCRRQPRAAARRPRRADAANPPVPHRAAPGRAARGVSRRAARQDQGPGAAQAAGRVPRHHRPHRRAVARHRRREGHRRRVLRLPLPVLPPRAADADAVAVEVPQRGEAGLQAHAARPVAPAGAPRGRGELVCAAARQVLAVPRPALLRRARRQRADALRAGRSRGAGPVGLPAVHGVGQGGRGGAAARGRRRQVRRQRHARLFRQRPIPQRRGAARGVRAGDRRRAGRGSRLAIRSSLQSEATRWPYAESTEACQPVARHQGPRPRGRARVARARFTLAVVAERTTTRRGCGNC